MREDTHVAAQRLVEPQPGEQPLHAADMVQMRVGDIDRARQFAIGRLMAVQRIRAAVDQQHRPAVALEHGRRGAQFHRMGRTDAKETQRPVHAPIVRS
jgi:hypothetical protein